MAVLKSEIYLVRNDEGELFLKVDQPFWHSIPELKDPYPNAKQKGDRFFTANRTIEYFDSESGSKFPVSVEIRFRWTIEKKLEVLSLTVGKPNEEVLLPIEALNEIKKLVQDTKFTIEGARRVSELLTIPREELHNSKFKEELLAEIVLSPFGLLGGYWDRKSKEFASVCLELVEWLRENKYPSPVNKAIELLSEASGEPIAKRTFEKRIQEAKKDRNRRIESAREELETYKNPTPKTRKTVKKGISK